MFKPERYLQENRLPYPNERGYNTFGFGRRQCSGQPLAEQGLYTSVCRLLWAFDIKPALDEQVLQGNLRLNFRDARFRLISLHTLMERICVHAFLERDSFLETRKSARRWRERHRKGGRGFENGMEKPNSISKTSFRRRELNLMQW